MKRLSVRELNALTSIIQDELQAHNYKKIKPKTFNAYVDAMVETQTEHLMRPYNKLLNRRDELLKEIKDMEVQIKNTFDLPGVYGRICQNNFTELKKEAEKSISKKYKLINVPNKFDIEKLIYKSGSEDFQQIVKSIVNQLSRKHEYTEV
jgi:hypothetical protein